MSDLKPIEPGCLCLIVNATHVENIGTTVTVVQIASISPYQGEITWEVESESLDPSKTWDGVYWAKESWLMRIDGHDEQETETSKRLEMVE